MSASTDDWDGARMGLGSWWANRRGPRTDGSRRWSPRLPRMGRRGLIAAVVLLLVVAGTGAWLLTRRAEPAAAQTITATVAAGTFQDTVSATGTLTPRRQADLDFAVSGRVVAVKVAAGDKVERGDVLARLDRTSLDAALTSAEAQLDAAQAQYADAVESDASSTQIAADSASVAAAESSLSQAQDDLDAATLKATMTGTVASVDLTVGDQVSGTSQSGSSGSGATSGTGSAPGGGGAASTGSGSSTTATTTATTAVVIISPRLYTVEADVSADDVTAVKEGMQAQVTPSGATQAVFGTVASVGLVAEANSSGAATFPVAVSITGPQAKLYAGTSATVSIITKQVSDVLSVPTPALHTRDSGTYVEKLVDGATVKTDVKLGATYGASTEVVAGLEVGDKVVVTTLQVPTGGTGRTGGNPGGGGFGGGTFPGGGAPPGGLPPGAPTGGGFGGGTP